MIDNSSQIVTDFEEKVVKKKNKCTAKKKKRLTKFYGFVESFLFLHSKSSPFLLPCFVPNLVPALVFAPMPISKPAPIFRS